MWMNRDTDVAFHVVENRSARQIGRGLCLPAITPQRSGRRWAYHSVMTPSLRSAGITRSLPPVRSFHS